MHKAIILLKKIPKGKVTTYGELARAAKTSSRAVGSIMRSNKHPEEYPCYKVIASDGSLGGYCGAVSGASLKKKIQLLKKDGIELKNGKIDLNKYLHKFS
ncbi:MAG: MGMT family protein [Candidatus Aenigmarchaeota archaeon]|nr:MGMT family protein [Candidatus Aenigmarchaeota archaeon]